MPVKRNLSLHDFSLTYDSARAAVDGKTLSWTERKETMRRLEDDPSYGEVLGELCEYLQGFRVLLAIDNFETLHHNEGEASHLFHRFAQIHNVELCCSP